jgi:hypothetical protein
VWTKRAVELLERIHNAVAAGSIDSDLLEIEPQVTDCNAAISRPIAGCQEILRRQRLLEGVWCLDPAESLGPGQKEEIDRVYAVPHLNDDFVRANLELWLG